MVRVSLVAGWPGVWLVMATLASSAQAGKIQFAVAEVPGIDVHGDSYVITIDESRPDLISHARALIERGELGDLVRVLVQSQRREQQPHEHDRAEHQAGRAPAPIELFLGRRVGVSRVQRLMVSLHGYRGRASDRRRRSASPASITLAPPRAGRRLDGGISIQPSTSGAVNALRYPTALEEHLGPSGQEHALVAPFHALRAAGGNHIHVPARAAMSGSRHG